jgi:hypothetical protein
MTTTAVNARKNRKGQEGLATVEAVPLLIIFIMLVGYGVGFFGAIHTGILHSIAARTYAFETFRNRTNLQIFRENTAPDQTNLYAYQNKGVRLHAVNAEDAPSGVEGFYVSRRPLSVGYRPEPGPEARQADHIEKIFTIQPRNQAVGVDRLWIMVSYGMCLDAGCGL